MIDHNGASPRLVVGTVLSRRSQVRRNLPRCVASCSVTLLRGASFSRLLDSNNTIPVMPVDMADRGLFSLRNKFILELSSSLPACFV